MSKTAHLYIWPTKFTQFGDSGPHCPPHAYAWGPNKLVVLCLTGHLSVDCSVAIYITVTFNVAYRSTWEQVINMGRVWNIAMRVFVYPLAYLLVDSLQVGCLYNYRRYMKLDWRYYAWLLCKRLMCNSLPKYCDEYMSMPCGCVFM